MATLFLAFEHPPAYLWGCTYSPHATSTFFKSVDTSSPNTNIGISIPTHAHVLKLTAYRQCTTAQGLRFQTMGTCILQIRRNTQSDANAQRQRKVSLYHLQPPLQAGGEIETTVPWSQCRQVRGTTVTVTSRRLECVFDVMSLYAQWARRCIDATRHRITMLQSAPLALPCRNFRGFIRNSQFDFDMPFPMPGALGIRAMAPTTFSIPMWIQLVYTACCLCGYDAARFAQSTITQQNNTLDALCVIALGSTWLSGYEYEKIDDTSTTWSSLGSFKDCEDFVITMVSLTTTLLDPTGLFTPVRLAAFFKHTRHTIFQHMAPIVVQLTLHLQQNFQSPCMVCGWIRPTPQDYEGHAWGAIFNNRLQQHMFVECTGPILPHVHDTTSATTLEDCVDMVYGGALRGPLSKLTVSGDTYGPASFRPTTRYVCIATQYTATSGMFIGPASSVNMIGVEATAFEHMQYTAQSLTRGTTLMPTLLQQTNYTPDFTDPVLLHDITRTLKTNNYATHECLSAQLETVQHNWQFTPSLFIASRCVPHNILEILQSQVLQADVIHPLPYMAGLLLFKPPTQ
jgi:hypothetical protein